MPRKATVPDALLLAQAEAARRLVAQKEAEALLARAAATAEGGSGSEHRSSSLSLAEEGDLSFYEDHALEKRAALLEDPQLAASVASVWETLDTVADPGDRSSIRGAGGGSSSRVLLEPQYLAFHRAMTKALVPDTRDDELPALAAADWESDTQRLGRFIQAPSGPGGMAKCLDEDGFKRSVLELVDLWTFSLDFEDYLGHVRTCEGIAEKLARARPKSMGGLRPGAGPRPCARGALKK